MFSKELNRSAISQRVFFSIGFFFINVTSITLLCVSATFFLHGEVRFWIFLLAVISSLAINYLVNDQYLPVKIGRKLLYLLVLPLLLLIFSICLACCFYDVSHDGQAYHQETLIQIDNGWNPYRQQLDEHVNQAIWVNHYAKGMEYTQAAIYSTLDRIEAGKATNMMLFLASFFLTLSFLEKISGLSVVKKVLISLLLATNPIAINQLFTYYVDGVLASLLLSLIVTMLLVLKEGKWYAYLLLINILIITINLKFTAVVYAGIFLLAGLVWMYITKQFTAFKYMLGAALLSVMLSLAVGFNPYITNSINFGHPFYPLMGPKKVNIFSHNLPATFEELPVTKKFFISLFSHTDNVMQHNDRLPSLKIPFTLNETDIINAPKVDARIGGFGPFFSGILLLSLFMFSFLLFRHSKHLLFIYLCVIGGVILISVAVIPESWWARYVPQFWYFPILILLIFEILKPDGFKILKRITYLLLIVNVSFTLIGIAWNLVISSQINYQMDTLRSSGETIAVQWGSAAANRIRFVEHQVPYKESKLDDLPGVAGIIRSDSKFLVPKHRNIVIELPFILKWTQKFMSRAN